MQHHPDHRALTIWQPYATLAAGGVKKIETRPWTTKYRGLVFIHAGKYRDEPCDTLAWNHKDDFRRLGSDIENVDWIHSLPRGAIVGCCRLDDIRPTVDLIERGQVTEKEKSLGIYEPDRFGLILTDPILFRTPVPCMGKQGLFKFSDDILTTALAALCASAGDFDIDRLLGSSIKEVA